VNRLREAAEFLVFQIVSAILLVTPRRTCLGLGRILGLLFFRLDARHRRIALANLATAFDAEIPDDTRYALARSSFVHFGRVVADVLKIASWPLSKIEALLDIEGQENLDRAVAQGRGVLVFTGHIGNWEMLPIPLARAAPLWAITRFLDNRLLERRLAGLRSRLGARIIYKDRAARQVLKVLGQGQIVIILIDQNVLRIQAVFVDFFGKAAGTTPALAAFYLRTGAPVVPVFCDFGQGGHYKVKILPALDLPAGGDHAQDVLKITQTCTKIIESQIRQFPEAWLWFHERWKSRPAEEA
jgi:KDO2-lipid IV(A) lauroyltransferase